MRPTVGLPLSVLASVVLPQIVCVQWPALAAAVPAVEISRDTTQATGQSQVDTQVEPHIAVDPSNPSIVVAVFQQGRFPDGGAVAPGYATSHDGGQTWTAGDLPFLTTATGGTFPRASDPVVAFGPDGAVYAQTLAFDDTRSAIAVQRSDDGGLTFGAPVLAHVDTSPALFNDKNWIAVDTFTMSPFRGRVYAAWDQLNSAGAPLLLRYSDTRGQTWGPLVTVSSPKALTIGAIPVVQPNGDLTVIYEDYSSGEDEVSQTSHNGGASFEPPVTIGSFQGGALPDIRSGSLPAAAVDAVTGDLFAVWQDRRFRTDGLRDIVLSRSTSGGNSWSTLARVNLDAPNSRTDHFTPAVAALNGRVHVVYRTRDTSAGLSPVVDMRYIVSTDGGATFGGEQVLGEPSNLQFAAQVTTHDCTNPPCYFLGDYMGIAASPQAVHPVWCRSFDDALVQSVRHSSTWTSMIGGACGDGVSEAGEDCDATDDAACPGSCQSDCTCACTNLVTDPKAKITVKTKRSAGRLSVRLVIPLAAYNGEPVRVRLDDGNSTPIARGDLDTLTPKGTRGKRWQYSVRAAGLKRVTLNDLGPRQPGSFRIVVKATKWFSAAAADQAAAATTLTINIGGQCFTHPATKKVD